MVCPYRRRLFLLALMLSIGFGGSGRLLAGPSTLKLLSEGAGETLTITYNKPTPDFSHGFTAAGFVGSMNLQLDNNAPFIGYCVDLAHFVQVGQGFEVNAYRTNSLTNGLTNGAAVAYLANTYGPYFSKISDPQERDIQAAGLQIAIWSELYNNGNGFSSGVFQFSVPQNTADPNYALDSAVASAATAYLNDAKNQSSVTSWYDGTPSGPGQWRGQNMVLADPPAAPEPPSVILFGVGLLGLGIVYQAKKGRRLTIIDSPNIA